MSKKVHVLRQLTRATSSMEEMEAAATAALEVATRPRGGLTAVALSTLVRRQVRTPDPGRGACAGTVLTARGGREKAAAAAGRGASTKRGAGVAPQHPVDAEARQMQATWNRQQQSVLTPGGVKGHGGQTCARNGMRGMNNRSFLERCARDEPYRLRERERGPGGLTREVETPLPSNSPREHMILRVDLVGSHGRWKRPCLQTALMTI
jgi:hypothetical protein